HQHLVVVAEQPDVVVHRPGLAVEVEGPRRDDPLDADLAGHSTTTERSTSPWRIRSNAASTSSSPIRSLTNASRSRRPCRYRSTSIGKSRLGRQSPYHEDLSEPPRAKKSSSGISMRMSGVGTPTSTTVPARSRA